MKLDSYSGPCGLNPHKRHRWQGKEFKILKGVFISQYGIICAHEDCQRVRVTEFTKRGNHIAGYRLATVDELAANAKFTGSAP